MANIGIAISGRKPGFQNFVLTDWHGTPPEDVSFMGRSAGEVYYTATLGYEYSVYERVLCRFNPGDGRTNVLKYSIQLPTGAMMMDAGGNPVSPKRVLDGLAAVVEGDVVVREGAMWRFRPGTIRPDFHQEQLMAVVAPLTLKALWGGSVVMQGANNPFFVECDDSVIPDYLMHLPYLAADRIAPLSMLVFGHFNSGDRMFIFTADDMEARPPVYLRVECSKSDKRYVMDRAEVPISTSQLGYDPACYQEESYILTYENVLRAHYAGVELPSFPWLSFELEPQAATVVVHVKPSPLEKTFVYSVEGVATDLARHKVLENLAFAARTGNYRPITREFTLAGEKIRDFEGEAAKGLAEYYRLDPASGYTLTDVRLAGDRILVKVKEIIVPKHAEKPAPHSATAAGSSLRVILPSALKGSHFRLFIEMPGGNGEETSMVLPARFENVDGKMVYEKLFAIALPQEVFVALGSPAKYRTRALRRPDDNGNDDILVADLNTSGSRVGAFGRFRDLFRFADSDYCSVGARFLRIACILAIFFVIFVIGGFFGGTLTSLLPDFLSRATEPMEVVTDVEIPEATTEEASQITPTPAPTPVPAPAPAPEPEPEVEPEPAGQAAPQSEPVPEDNSLPPAATEQGKQQEPSPVQGKSNTLR